MPNFTKQGIDNLMNKLPVAIQQENYLSATGLALELAQVFHGLWLDKVRFEYRLATPDERQVDSELLAACKAALEDGSDYKLSGTVKRQLQEVIERAERFVSLAAKDDLIIMAEDGSRFRITATRVEDK